MQKMLVLFISACLFLTEAVAQQVILKIKVVDENNLNMPGASVTLSGSNSKIISDVNGNAILTNLKTGNLQISISYIGYAVLKSDINLTSGVNEHIFVLKQASDNMRSILILGDRLKGQAKALNQQKNNGNIGNIISADQIGRFPDQNIGDALKRVPGITMQNDQGEARDIIIRGLAPQLNAVTLNGTRIPSAEGDNRRVQMDLIPSDMIQTVEVSKTLTPDMDADAIGGSVNLITRPAPNKFRFSTTISGGKNQIRDGNIFNLSMLAGGRLFNNKLGIVGALTMNDNNYGSDNVEAVWAQGAPGWVYLSEHDIRKYDVKRTRRSFNTTIDYRFNKKNTVTLSGMYNWRDDWENRYRLRVTGISPQFSSGLFTGYRGEVRAQTKGGLDNDRIKARRLEEQIVKTASAKGEHILGKAILEWSSSVSRASEYRPNERYLEYNRTNQFLKMDLVDPSMPYVTTFSPLGAADLNFRRLTEQFGDVYENDWTTKMNLKLPFVLGNGLNGSLKIGGRFSDRSKERVNDFYRYTPTAATLAQMKTMSQVTYASQNVYNFQAGSKYLPGPFATPDYLGNTQLDGNAGFTKAQRNEEFLALNYRAKEKISAAFIRYDQELSKVVSVIAGIRFEGTSVDYTGNNVLNETTLQGTTSLKSNYLNILPSFNLRYEPKDDLVYRFGVTTGIARPGYYELVPYRNVLSADNEITVGNPNLKATESVNVDVMVEKYFKSVGILSGGVFFKKLKNFIYVSVDPTYDSLDFQRQYNPATGGNPIPAGSNFTYRTSLNGNSVDVYGFELAFQRQLDFLPGFLKNFGMFVNYTYTFSTADGIYNIDGVKREGLSLPGTAPHMFNASLSYETKKVTARISANYSASYIDEIGSSSFFDRYYDKQFFLDFNASYAFTPKIRLFTEINNITNQPLRYFQGEKSRTMQLEYYRLRGIVGLKMDLF
jgi:TonB-dependent receptor